MSKLEIVLLVIVIWFALGQLLLAMISERKIRKTTFYVLLVIITLPITALFIGLFEIHTKRRKRDEH